MLSDEHKAGLKSAVECMVESHGMAHLAKEGPAAFLDGMIAAAKMRVREFGCDGSRQALEIFTANRPECERYIAGLLGMM